LCLKFVFKKTEISPTLQLPRYPTWQEAPSSRKPSGTSMLAMMGGAGTGEVSSKMLEIHGELSSLGFLWDVHG